MYRLTTRALTTTVALLCLVLALPAGDAVAQQKQQVSFSSPAQDSKFTQQQNVEIRDVPNHIVRVFEVHRTFPNPPVINGLKIVEAWDSGITDRIEGNGPVMVYTVCVMENGDKFVARLEGLVQTSSGGKLTAANFGPITGGTGKLAGIQGTVRQVANFDPQSGFNDTQYEVVYSIGK